ncbi:hypothetical protein [Sorangium sp. So ce128]|uniref:hypothetical protein n=1 Tax=Sorangium sp. So ce128 TaxID=3133281 RepID=UPI003F62C234
MLLARLEYAALQQLFSDLPAETTRSLELALDLLAADQPATPLEGRTGRRRAR